MSIFEKRLLVEQAAGIIYRIGVITTPGFYFSKMVFVWESIEIWQRFDHFLLIFSGFMTDFEFKFSVDGFLFKSRVQIKHMRCTVESNLKRFFLSNEKCLPFEITKFFPFANSKNFCHFKMISIWFEMRYHFFCFYKCYDKIH